jgi:hypothetical protein
MEMKLINDTNDNIAVPLKDGGYADLAPGEEKNISNVNTDHQRFKGLMHASALRDVEAKTTEAARSATAQVNEKK